jgi:hypothetical protein
VRQQQQQPPGHTGDTLWLLSSLHRVRQAGMQSCATSTDTVQCHPAVCSSPPSCCWLGHPMMMCLLLCSCSPSTAAMSLLPQQHVLLPLIPYAIEPAMLSAPCWEPECQPLLTVPLPQHEDHQLPHVCALNCVETERSWPGLSSLPHHEAAATCTLGMRAAKHMLQCPGCVIAYAARAWALDVHVGWVLPSARNAALPFDVTT